MSVNVEESDLDVRLKFAFVCDGSMRDFIKLRDHIRSLAKVDLIYNTNSASYLVIVKKEDLTEEQRACLERKQR
ncbi:MAG: hypothetical protein ACQCN6_01625 [Candidatus Bathyarchaeia archaeon]|jgi:hypothetical protein